MMEGSFILRFAIDVRKYVRYNKKERFNSKAKE